MSNTVHWLLELSINEGKLAEFKTLMNEMVETTKNESGTIAYEWYFNDSESLCCISERYEDSDATLTHLQSFGGSFAERFMACVTPTRFTVLGNPNKAVREGLAGLNPSYLALKAGFSK